MQSAISPSTGVSRPLGGNVRSLAARLPCRRGARQAAAALAGDDEAWRLAEENERLRRAASKALEGLSVEQRTAIEQQHAALRAQAAAAGMELPTLGSEAAEQQRGAASAPVGNGSRGSAMAVPGSSSQAGSSAGGQKPDTLVLGGAAPSAAASASGHASAAAPGATGTGAKPAAAGSMAAKPSHAELKAAASKQVLEHKPGVAAKGKEAWLYFTVPEQPVAGAPCVLYYNRSQSEPLRNSNRLQLHAKYNCWEVAAPEGDRADLTHEGGINRAEGVDYYRTQLQVPEEAYELNFVFSNGDGMFDNNNTQNYMLPVLGPMTQEKWIETAPERAEAAWKAKKEQEAKAAAEAAAAEVKRKADEDARKAAEAVADLKGQYKAWREGAAKQEAGRWRMVPSSVSPGGTIILQYNRKAGPLAGFDVQADQSLTLKIGHNTWREPKDLKMKRVPLAPATPPAAASTTAATGATVAPVGVAPAAPPSDEEWWEALVPVPFDAAVLNWVVAYFDHYDNNDRKDFKVLIDLPKGQTLEAWADSLQPQLLEHITTTRRAKEAEVAEVERVRRAARVAAQEKAEAVRRKQMKHVLFTVPEVVEAGGEVTVYYNPNNGALPGRERVWIKGGYNRWRHPKGFGPLEMTPPKTGDHFQATFKVPKDAYTVDFVFTDAEEYGQYDSNGGLDFHLPVEGSVVEEPPLHVVHIAVEMAPICKVGGLGDVVTSLGRAVKEEGHTVEVIIPKYGFFGGSPLLGGTQYETEFDFGGTKVFVSTCEVEGLRCFFIEPRNGMFDGAVYQGYNDGPRFDFFSRAALEFLLRSGRQPDILHCHDWSSADVAKAYWNEYHNYGLWKPKVIFTIHNLDFGQIKLGEAAYYSQKFTTVSPSYAWEIGGHPAIAPNCGKLMGVRNGIDIDIWDPETDMFLPRGYTAETVVEGKAAARQELRNRLGMSGWGDKPLVGVVSRLTKQKGTHLIAHACFRALDRGGQFVLLGSAPDPKIQAEFNGLKDRVNGSDAGFAFTFDEPLSHLIYAACDIIVVPSMFEPCGLTQMIAMRYGAVPVVRQTGGLKDTVFDVDNDKARAAWEMEGSTDWLADGVDATNGFSFEGTDEGALDYALNRALDAYYMDRAWWHSLQKRVMLQDWSWNKPAHTYIELYHAAKGQ